MNIHRLTVVIRCCAVIMVITGRAYPQETGNTFPSLYGTHAGELCIIDGIRLRWCPAGDFIMGSPEEETGRRPDEFQVRVTLTKGFWIGQFEITQGQWIATMGSFPDKEPTPFWGLGHQYPVYWISHTEAESFCQTLTKNLHQSGELPENQEFRLPTEAQWEYACRAGTYTATAYGDTLRHDQANFSGLPLNDTTRSPVLNRASEVGSYPSNTWGIHDMHGNIFEWCRDWYHARLPGGRDPDPYHQKGAQNRDGTYSRVRRGGAWNDDGIFCRSAFRLRYEPERRSDHIGFRVVLVEK